MVDSCFNAIFTRSVHDLSKAHWATIEREEYLRIVRERKSGNRTYFIVNRHVNYTNVCTNHCRFCAFSREQGQDGAYTMTLPEILEAATAGDESFSELHIVGGLHPDLPFSYYTEMLSQLKGALPDVHMQAFTAVEIAHLATLADLPIRETLEQLIEAVKGQLEGYERLDYSKPSPKGPVRRPRKR